MLQRPAFGSIGGLASRLLIGVSLCTVLASAALAATVAHFQANLDHAQEFPPAPVPVPGATGTGLVTLDTETNTLSWHITFSGLSGPPTAMHFHGPAAPGASAAPVVTIGGLTSPSTGSATITPTQTADLLAGLWYVNIHTANNAGGEIRGQVVGSLPRVISHQGFLTDDLGAPVTDPSTSMTFTLYDAAGVSVWTETQTVAVSGGFFSVDLGSTTPLALPFSERYFLGIQVGADPEMSPRLALSASPYALRAGTVERDADALGALACAAGEVAKWSGSAWECQPDADTQASALDWSALTGKPAGFDDDVDDDVLGQLSCAPGEVAKWSGGAWECQPDVDTDTDTDTLGSLSCASGQVAKWNGSGWECQTAQFDLQACPPGAFVRGTDASGAVVCSLLPVGDRQVAVDGGTGSGFDIGTSVAIGVDGLPVISHVNQGDLRVVHCGDTACASITVTTVDSIGIASGNQYTSIAIGVDGLPVVGYFFGGTESLKLARCGDVACTSSTLTTVVGPGNGAGRWTSVAIGTDGLPLLSHFNAGILGLEVAHCDDADCTSSTRTTIDSGPGIGGYSSIAIGADGLPVISYFDGGNGTLKVAHCATAACTTSALTTVDGGDVGRYTSIAIGVDGLPVISYWDTGNTDLKVAHCDDAACTASTLTIVDTGNVGSHSSLAIGADGLPVISYYDLGNARLKVAHCDDAACTSSTTVTVSSADFGDTSIAIGNDGLPVIGYHDGGVANVRHCSEFDCSPDRDALGALNCSTDQIAKWNGSAWTCADDGDSNEGVCPSNWDAVADWCIDQGHTGAEQAVHPVAMLTCWNIGAQLCPIQAIIACDSLQPSGATCSDWTDSDGERIWASEISSDSGTIGWDSVDGDGLTFTANGLITNELTFRPRTGTYKFLCCRSR